MGRRNVAGMGVARRIEVGGVAVLAVAAMALGIGVSVAAIQLPPAVAQALSVAGEALGWLRLAVAAALIYGVARAREEL